MCFHSRARHGGRFAALCLFVIGLVPGLALADLVEFQQLVSNPTISDGHSGQSVSISGDTALIGAPDDNGGTGAAYVWTFDGMGWNNVATLTASDGAVGDKFGAAVQIGTQGHIAIGAPGRDSGAGAVYTYTGGGSTWTQNLTVLVNGTVPSGHLGTSVSIQGFRVAGGAPTTSVNNTSNTGVVVVFNSNDSGATWNRSTFRPNGGQARTGALFGTSVSLDGSTIAVGAPDFHTGIKQNSGSLFVFVNNGGSWTQQARLRPANVTNYYAGTSVSLSGDTIAVGTPGANSSKGAVYVYSRSGTTWGSAGTLIAADGQSGDGFGDSVAVSGLFVIVGAPGTSGGGKAYEFANVGGSYSLQNALVASGADTAAGDLYGNSVAFSSGRAIVGAPYNDNAPGTDNGAAYVFDIQQPSVTTITGFSATPSLTNVPYTVSVHVDHDVGGSGTPTGSVMLDDQNGGSCVATLDGSGDGSCELTSSFFGTLTMNANYGGDANFSPSSDSQSHDITGNHLAFDPAPADILQGVSLGDVTVDLLDGANQIITGNSTTNVTLTVDDACGNLAVPVATMQVLNGVAAFTGISARFYTIDSVGLHAIADDGSSQADSNFNVLDNTAELLFANGFEECTP
jgi:hypothetical protein